MESSAMRWPWRNQKTAEHEDVQNVLDDHEERIGKNTKDIKRNTARLRSIQAELGIYGEPSASNDDN